MTNAGPEAIGYTAAIAELDGILRQLETEDVDVDLLSARVMRAVELVALCRERIDAAEIEVNSIVAELTDGNSEAPG